LTRPPRESQSLDTHFNRGDSTTVRDLGLYLASDLAMQSQIQKTRLRDVLPSFVGCQVSAAQSQQRFTRRSSSHCMVLPRLDAITRCWPTFQKFRLTTTTGFDTLRTHAAARSIAGMRLSENITDALASFHRLRTPEHVQFKLAVLAFRALHGLAHSL
jgi:hypothetical protein